MITDTRTLYGKMHNALQQAAAQDDVLQYAEQAYHIVTTVLQELRESVLNNTFKDEQEEIQFFKEEKPKFVQELIYFAELFYVESGRPVGTTEAQKQYFLKHLERIRIYFDRNKYLYNYYRTGQSYLDHIYFLREADEIPLLPDYSFDIDPRFSTVYSYKVSKLQALEQLKDYLQTAIRRLDNPLIPANSRHDKKRWHGTKAELIELGYALQSRGVFGNADVKQVISYLEDCFDIKVGNFYRVFQGQRIRKKSRTLFLDSLKENLIRRMDESDLNPGNIG